MHISNLFVNLQDCKFEVGSYAHDTSEIRFETKLNSIEIQNNKKHDYISHINKLKRKDMKRYWSSTQANYSIAGFQISFDRHTAKYIIQYYLTSGFFVCVSWVSICCYSQKYSTFKFSKKSE